MCACFLKREFCHLLSNVSFLILTSAGSLILAFLASLTMKRTQKRQCFLSMNLPADQLTIGQSLRLKCTARASQHLGWTLWKRHQSSHIGKINSMASDGAIVFLFYPVVHLFFMISQDLINCMTTLKVLKLFALYLFFSFLFSFFFRCVTLIETSVYSLHSSYFSFNIVTGPSKANNI